MDTRSKNIILVSFVVAVAVAIFTWLYIVNRNNPIDTSVIFPNTQNTPTTSSTPNQLPATQPSQNKNNNQTANNNPNQPTNTIQKLPEPPPVPGNKIDAPDVLEKYGKYAFEAFDKSPALVEKLQEIYPTFKTEMMYVSFPSQAYHLSNGKDYLALGGCTEHDCGGTGVIVLYNLTNDKIYMGKEGKSQIGFEKYFGDPSEDEKNTMLNYYFQK
jgi:hypothetical protein